MKKLIVICFLLTLMSCERGSTTMCLTGEESSLPSELKGLKVYTISTGMSYVKVAVLNNQINSATYSEGKTTHTTIIINPKNETTRTIECKEIISETDDIIIIRKK